MFKLKKTALTLVMLFILSLTAVSPVWAAPTPAGFNVWAYKTTDNTLKVWSIKFNMPLSPASVNGSSIYVLDDSSQRLAATVALSADGTVVTVTPAQAYNAAKEYRLFVTSGVANPKGVPLAQQIIVPFVVVDPNTSINLIDCQYSSLLTNVTVVASPGVYAVNVNQQTMHYLGNNVFSLGLTDIAQGGSLSVQAYDSAGKLLSTQTKNVE